MMMVVGNKQLPIIKNICNDIYTGHQSEMAGAFDMERFAQVRIIEVFNGAPETVFGICAFGKKTVDMRGPFKWTPKGMKDANKTWNRIF